MRKNTLFVSMIFALLLSISFTASSQKTKLPESKFFRIIKIEACFYASTSTSGDNLFLPVVEFTFIPKISMSYFELNGTFVDPKDTSSLGRAMSNAQNLEPGIKYKLRLQASTGWTALFKQKASIQVYYLPSVFAERIPLIKITKFQLNECLYPN
jgi:hypothetical protein